MSEQVFWVYILYCENNTYYTGITNDIKRRYQSHVDGTGKCKYTRSFKPVKIAQCWKITNGGKSEALKLEKFIKKLSRIAKDKLISNPSSLSENAIPLGDIS